MEIVTGTSSADIMNHSIEEMNEFYTEKAGSLDLYEACHPCDRYIWLALRRISTWAIPCAFYKRLKRCEFEKFVQATYVEAFLKCSVKNQITDEKYQPVHYGYITDTPDGFIPKGVPESPKKPHLLSVWVKNNPIYTQEQAFARAQCLMFLTEIDRTLMLTVNTETEKVHSDRLRLTKKIAKDYLDRAIDICCSDNMPSSCTDTNHCRMCPYYRFCFETNKTDFINCMSCARLMVRRDGLYCQRGNTVNLKATHFPCHIINPDLMPWEVVELTPSNVAYRLENERVIYQGDTSFSSEDMMNGRMETVDKIATSFNGDIEYTECYYEDERIPF